LSLEELRRAVLERARLEAEEIVKEAEKKAMSIVKEAEERKRVLVEEERRKALSELGLEAKLAEARRKARLIVAKTKHEIVEELRRRARELLNNMGADARRRSLRELLFESLDELRACGFDLEGVAVRVSPKDRSVIEDLLREAGVSTIVVEDQGISGGIIVSTVGGEVSVDNTYETRLERALRDIVSELFGGGLP
jgi:V/A-type H+-transporting ATPase subunit E